MGATIAIRMAALHPEHVKGLFLISLLPPEEVRHSFLFRGSGSRIEQIIDSEDCFFSDLTCSLPRVRSPSLSRSPAGLVR